MKTKLNRYSTERLQKEIERNLSNPEVLREIYNILEIRIKFKYHSVQAQNTLQKEKEESITPIHYGSKHEPYYTEKEMEEKFKCTYEDLSKEEKEMYDKIEERSYWNNKAKYGYEEV